MNDQDRIPLLITGADSQLSRAVMAARIPLAQVRAVDRHFSKPVPNGVEAYEGDLRDPLFVTTMLENVGAILHLAPIYTRYDDDLETLDHATRGTYELATLAAERGVQRLLLGSTLDLFERCPARWRIDEAWRPRPTPGIADLAAWLSECSARELARDSGLQTICLRFGHVIEDVDVAELPYDPRWLHIADATAAIDRALALASTGWSVFHITAAGRRAKVRQAATSRVSFGYQPQHDFHERWSWDPTADANTEPTKPWQSLFAPTQPRSVRGINNVVVFGAGGPLAAAAAHELVSSYTLRLADLFPLAEVLNREGSRPPGAPLPLQLDLPHEWRVVDVTDPAQVLSACAGMDAIVNCTVVRRDPVEAFRVNLLGAYNIMRAASVCHIRRVVHTGPFMVAPLGVSSYAWDYEVSDDAPPRPGSGHRFQLYFHTKYLGQETCRVFAEYYGIEVPALLFCEFVTPGYPVAEDFYPFSVSFADAARAIRRSLEVSALPTPYEVLHITADLPHGVFPNRKVRRVLDWQPRDDLCQCWSD